MTEEASIQVPSSNEEWVELLRRSVPEFNKVRKEHPELIPDLFRANLRGLNISGANLEGAYLFGASLCGANLSGVVFNKNTFLVGINLGCATNVPEEFFDQMVRQTRESIESIVPANK